MEPRDTREQPLGPETRRALGIRVRVWRPKKEEKQLCLSRCLRNYCSCSVAAPSGEGASGSFHLQHHKWVDRRRRSVVSDFAGNWVFNIFLWKKFFWVPSAGVRNQDSLGEVCWFVTEICGCRWWMELSELKKERSSSKKIRRRRRREKRRWVHGCTILEPCIIWRKNSSEKEWLIAEVGAARACYISESIWFSN